MRVPAFTLPLVLAVSASAASAQERPFAPAMACRDVSALVSRLGAVLIGTGPATYDRIVTNTGLCPIEETTVPAWTATRDSSQCFVGYRCKDKFTEGRDRE